MILLCLKLVPGIVVGWLVTYSPLSLITSTESKQAIGKRLLQLSNELNELINQNRKEKEAR